MLSYSSMYVKVKQQSDLVQKFSFCTTATQELCSEGEVFENLNVSKKKDQ